jgi:hypothetical protein
MPREGLLTALSKQLDAGRVEYSETIKSGTETHKEKRTITLAGKLIHLCFTCDPYPIGHDTSITREAIAMLKSAGCHVQILTKGGADAERDFDLLGKDDWFGITYTGLTNGVGATNAEEPGAAPDSERMMTLSRAKANGINTWVSCEPVLDPFGVLSIINYSNRVDLYRIGKLNHHPSIIDWGAFGRNVEKACHERGRAYYIKADLRSEMMKGE